MSRFDYTVPRSHLKAMRTQRNPQICRPHPGIQWDTIFGLILRVAPILALVLALDGFFCYLKARSYRFELGP
jgi:hypothetical protein